MLLSEHLCFDRTNLSQRSLRGGPPPARECLAGRRRPASARAPRASPAAPRRDRAAWGSQQCGTGPCGGAVLSRRVCRGPRPPHQASSCAAALQAQLITSRAARAPRPRSARADSSRAAAAAAWASAPTSARCRRRNWRARAWSPPRAAGTPGAESGAASVLGRDRVSRSARMSWAAREPQSDSGLCAVPGGAAGWPSGRASWAGASNMGAHPLAAFHEDAALAPLGVERPVEGAACVCREPRPGKRAARACGDHRGHPGFRGTAPEARPRFPTCGAHAIWRSRPCRSSCCTGSATARSCSSCTHPPRSPRTACSPAAARRRRAPSMRSPLPRAGGTTQCWCSACRCSRRAR